MRPSSKPANPESPRLRSRRAVNRNGGRLACVDGGRKHRLPHKRGSSEPEGCVRCSPAATRRHAAMARLAVVPAPGSWPLENVTRWLGNPYFRIRQPDAALAAGVAKQVRVGSVAKDARRGPVLIEQQSHPPFLDCTPYRD